MRIVVALLVLALLAGSGWWLLQGSIQADAAPAVVREPTTVAD